MIVHPEVLAGEEGASKGEDFGDTGGAEPGSDVGGRML